MSDSPISERQQFWLDHLRSAEAFDGSVAVNAPLTLNRVTPYTGMDRNTIPTRPLKTNLFRCFEIYIEIKRLLQAKKLFGQAAALS